MLSRRCVIETSAKSPIATAISSAATGLEPFADLLAVQIDQEQRMHVGRPFGVGCVSDRPFNVRDADDRLIKHGCALPCRRAEELKAVYRRPRLTPNYSTRPAASTSRGGAQKTTRCRRGKRVPGDWARHRQDLRPTGGSTTCSLTRLKSEISSGD